MTSEDRLAKLEEQMIVQAGLMARLETRLDRFAANVNTWVNSAETRFARLEVMQETTQTALAALIANIDRFLLRA